MPLLWVTLFFETLRAIWVRKPDVIHCAQIIETGWIGYLCKRIFGIPYIVHFYGEEIRIHRQRFLPRFLQSLVLKHASGVSVLTRFTDQLLREHTGYAGATTLAYPGVDLESFGPLPGCERSSRPVLLTLGRLMERKGHDRVLEAVARLRVDFPDLEYLIVGGGPYEATLRSQVAGLGLSDCVKFLGRLPHAEVLRLLNSSNIFVHPNRELANGDVEGFGIVFLEASACRLPVIGGDSGGAREAIQDGISGFLVDPQDVDQIVDRVAQLLRSPQLWTAMSEAGPDWAAQFTWDRSSRALWELTLRALNPLQSGQSVVENVQA